MVRLQVVCDHSRVTVTTLIVDDHPAFRASARRLLELEGFAVVGEAHDGSAALRLARELDPELVLLDVSLPDLSGYEVAERLSGARARVILVSSREQSDLGRRVRESGALGFLPKDRLSGEAIHDLLGTAP